MPEAWKNKLFFGDNLHILRKRVAAESVHLVYLDPPSTRLATCSARKRRRGILDHCRRLG